jgi:hypothetical protein
MSNVKSRTDCRHPGARRAIAAAVLALACGVMPALAAERVTHVHVGDRELSALLDRGMAASETLRTIVERLDGAPIQVFANCDAQLPEGLSGRLRFLSSVGGVRYVQVTVRCSLPPGRQLSFLAHELQHAVEIADNVEIADADSMESYYADVGFETHVDNSHHRSFETDAAISVQRRVERELKNKSSREDEAEAGQHAPQ